VEEPSYSRQFFIQLRSIFGRFRESDLQRAFESAQPIQCSELISDKGEWRTVAFFNERRELGDWYRRNFDEVKSDLAVFSFKGVCRGERGPVQLTTKFPISESIEAFNQGRIELEQIDVNVNAPVSAFFDMQNRAYSWDLPYLFLVSRQDGDSLYSLNAPRLSDRYAADVLDHWDCKSVTAEAVTYRFLICRTTTLPRNPALRSQLRTPAFGASAYFILSDGREAASSVKLTFSDTDDVKHSVEDKTSAPTSGVANVSSWQNPDSDERIVSFQRDEFRIRFSPESWSGRLGSSQVLSGQRLSSLAASNPNEGADYCIWLPDAPYSADLLTSEPDAAILYSLSATDQDRQSATSIVFDLNTRGKAHLGSIKCIFPRLATAGSVPFSRWSTVVGPHLILEIR
jgi:hypothetical protein